MTDNAHEQHQAKCLACAGGWDALDLGSRWARLPCRVEQMLEGLKMGWVFKKPARLARPSDDSQHGLNTVSPLLGEFILFL